MTKYSHTRLSTFENCPLQYRFRYVDGIEAPFQKTDSTFLGSMCHAALEKLYRDRMDGKIDSKEEVTRSFEDLWDSEYRADEIMHPEEDKGPDFYRRLGRGWVERYYDEFFVNDDMEVLGVETDDTLALPDGNEYYIRIDKLGFKDGTYYVCDYKTDRRPKEQSAADDDRQLAMYALWVRRTFPDAKDVKLLWHMLRFSGDQAQTVSTRSPEQLDELERSVTEEIRTIENTEVFEPSENAYCTSCVYQGMCPKFAPPKVLTIDDATDLADELIGNKEDIKRLEDRNKRIEADLCGIVSENLCDLISGTHKDLTVKPLRSVEYVDKDAVVRTLKENGRYDRYVQFDTRAFNQDVLNGSADPDVYRFVSLKEGFTFRSKKKST